MKKKAAEPLPGLPLKFTAAYTSFEAAREALNGFRHEYEDVFKEYDQLCTKYNEALEEVKRQYRANHERIGTRYKDFKITTKTNIDVCALYDLMKETHAELFSQVLTLDRDKYKAAVSRGSIPANIVEDVESEGGISVYGPPKQ